MAYDADLAERVRAQFGAVKKVTEQEMFGGIGFMVAGHMVCGIRGPDLLVRVGPDLHQDALTRPHVREMDFTGRSMRGFVTVGPEGTADDSELALWVRLGLAHAQSLPPKKKAPAKKTAPAKKKAAPKKKAARRRTR